ncbi:Motility protein B [Austwickia sp. TVS 96-490-7B]|uniref:OmpA family protein n=1 Tax=Austwickia sp. TVS 96-490-7B TaxID=2830843 RepID=UPI001C58EB87|nr:OmpA family protein [Austwickia sp. TVS 96-490-7B]MBW3083919.1 Motility protein B [Austwickia sp. TVS 96-490-7B]
MAKKKKAPEPEPHANHERWMISYADMLTLLLALFIVMFAVSKVDQAKFVQFAQGANQAFGGAGSVVLNGYGGSETGSDGIMQNNKPPATEGQNLDPQKAAQMIATEQARKAAQEAEKSRLDELKKQLESELSQKGLKDAVQMVTDERGLVVNIITDKVLFDTGTASIRSAGAKVIDLIAPSLKSLPNKITVEGHTDNVPIRTAQFPSNWELSTARAAAVLQVLVKDGLEENRLTLAGYGDQRPIDSNATDSGRSRNRRVAVVVMANVTQPLASPSAVASPTPIVTATH